MLWFVYFLFHSSVGFLTLNFFQYNFRNASKIRIQLKSFLALYSILFFVKETFVYFVF